MSSKDPVVEIPIIIEKDHGSYYAYSPVLKGLHVDGETEEEALKNAKEAVDVYISSLKKHNEPIPLDLLNAEKQKEQKKIYKILRFHKKYHLEHIPATI